MSVVLCRLALRDVLSLGESAEGLSLSFLEKLWTCWAAFLFAEVLWAPMLTCLMTETFLPMLEEKRKDAA